MKERERKKEKNKYLLSKKVFSPWLCCNPYRKLFAKRRNNYQRESRTTL